MSNFSDQSKTIADYSYSKAFLALLSRDLRLAYIQKNEFFNPLVFLVVVIALLPLALGSDKQLLSKVAPALIWIAALLSTLISLERLFQQDFEDGSLEQMYLSGYPLFVLALAKIAAHWLISGLPLVLICPFLMFSFIGESELIKVMLLSLLLGTPTLSCISAISAALTVNVGQGGFLVALITLPFYIPVLVFGAGAVSLVSNGESGQGPLLVLAAFLLLSVSLAPFAISGGLRLNIADS